MRSLRLRHRIQCVERRAGRIGKERDRWRRYELERRRREVARIAGVKRCRVTRLPNHIDPRAQLSLADKLGELIVARTEIDGNGWDDLPLVLQIIAVNPSGLAP